MSSAMPPSLRVTPRLSSHDLEALHTHHEFVRDDHKDRQLLNSSWEMRMARKFYNKLFKEFALADLSKYREGKVGLRWRTEAEVEMGKGHLSCGGLHCTRPAETSSSVSSEDSSLHSYEVPFQYQEGDEMKLELVKVRLCPSCAEKLFYRSIQARGKGKEQRQQGKQPQQKGEEEEAGKGNSTKLAASESSIDSGNGRKRRKVGLSS